MTSKSASEEDSRQQLTANSTSQETSVHCAVQKKGNYWLWLIASLALQYFLNTDGKKKNNPSKMHLEQNTDVLLSGALVNGWILSQVLAEWASQR